VNLTLMVWPRRLRHRQLARCRRLGTTDRANGSRDRQGCLKCFQVPVCARHASAVTTVGCSAFSNSRQLLFTPLARIDTTVAAYQSFDAQRRECTLFLAVIRPVTQPQCSPRCRDGACPKGDRPSSCPLPNLRLLIWSMVTSWRVPDQGAIINVMVQRRFPRAHTAVLGESLLWKNGSAAGGRSTLRSGCGRRVRLARVSPAPHNQMAGAGLGEESSRVVVWRQFRGFRR